MNAASEEMSNHSSFSHTSIGLNNEKNSRGKAAKAEKAEKDPQTNMFIPTTGESTKSVCQRLPTGSSTNSPEHTHPVLLPVLTSSATVSLSLSFSATA